MHRPAAAAAAAATTPDRVSIWSSPGLRTTGDSAQLCKQVIFPIMGGSLHLELLLSAAVLYSTLDGKCKERL